MYQHYDAYTFVDLIRARLDLDDDHIDRGVLTTTITTKREHWAESDPFEQMVSGLIGGLDVDEPLTDIASLGALS